MKNRFVLFSIRSWLISRLYAANAGFLSGFSGIESVPGPQLPQIDFLNRFNGSITFKFIWRGQKRFNRSINLTFETGVQKRTRRNTRKLMPDSNHLPCWRNFWSDRRWTRKSKTRFRLFFFLRFHHKFG